MKLFKLLGFSLLFLTTFSLTAPAFAEELVVYSARKEHLIEPLFKAYSEKTGIEFKYITDKAGPLMARLKAEGANTPADLLITVDAGNLWQAAEAGLLQPLDSPVLAENVPPFLHRARLP